MSITDKFPNLGLSNLPTPIHKLNYLSEELGANLFIKRDDLTGMSFGGNKTRKLDFLIADAKNKGCNSVIAIGANQSNFCRLATAYAISNGLDAKLVLKGKKPESPTGNLLLNHLFGAEIIHLEEGITKKRAWEWEQELLGKGEKPYRMPSGGSTDIGGLGYVRFVEEVMAYEKVEGTKFDYLIFSTGSGGTQAGLMAGKVAFDWDTDILGISVSREKEGLAKVVDILANQTLDLLDISKRLDTHYIQIDDSYIGEAYGVPTPKGEEAIEVFAKKEGVLLDRVYTGKGASGLIDLVGKEEKFKGKNILFLHTGGNVQLFAK
ncbi:MAG: D-cysteine desulfhydrase family protein [Bacteroidia bacterium]|nr:D-cysteine desulfhydrase family protein [Bacteroidia bacterium]